MALVPFKKAQDDDKPALGQYEGPAVDPEDDDESLGDGRMSFLDHLDELRRRLTHAVVALLVGFLAAFAFAQQAQDFVMEPLLATLPAGGHFIYTEPTEAFFLQLKIAAILGLIIASPYVMWQVWLFIAPGLYANEKRFAVPFVVGTTVLFTAGAAFSHYVVFPAAFRFFGGFSNDRVIFTPRIEPVFGMYAWLLLAMGLIFQMPMLVMVLARMGLVTARFLIRNFKYAILVNFIIAAIATPSPDPVSQTVVAAPMCVLYVISIGVAWMFQKRRSTDEDDGDEGK
ncbi:MAG: twin-arginine translocase subunit TatC [Vicinamibacterales bacterium]